MMDNLPTRSELTELWPYLNPLEADEVSKLIAGKKNGPEEIRARNDLVSFCHYVQNDFKSPRHICVLAEKLAQVERYVETNGEEGIGRLIINMPPRHGKSLTASKRWPSFILGRHRKWRFGILAYNDDFVQDFGRANRDLISNNERYAVLFSDVKISGSSSAVGRWSLEGIGSDDPSFVATSLGGTLTGRGFKIVIIDDPVRERKEAESPAYRKDVKEAYQSSVRTRLEPGGAILIICTRWHEDDLPGWLLAQQKIGEGEDWEVLNLPALAEKNDPLERAENESLWAERYDNKTLLATKHGIGSYEWEAQFQGHPKPPEGGKIKRTWFNVIEELPARFRPIGGYPPAEFLEWFRYWDLAVTAKTTSNFTASCRLAFDDEGNLYIADMIRERWEWPDQKREIKKTMISERALGVKHGIEKALHGAAAVQEFLTEKELRGVAFVGIDVDKDKLTRALPWIARAEAGKVYLISGVWIGAFLDECGNFTGHNDKEDDQVDSVSGGVAMADQKPKELETVENPFF